MRSFLFICISALVLEAGCRKNAGSGIELDSSFSAFLQPTTKALIGVRVEKLKTSDFYKRHESQFKLPQISAMSQQIGVDPARDISEIVIAWDGKQVLTMARGSFKSEDVQQKISGLSTAQEKYKNLTLFGSKSEAVAFLPKGMVVAGPSDELKRSLDEAAAGSGNVPDELQMRLHGVLSNAQIWGASQGVLPLANIPMRSDVGSGLSNLVDYVNGTTLGVFFDSGAHLKLDVSCVSGEGAQRVNDALRGLIGFARLSTKDNELDMLRLWDAIKVEKTERGVLVHADLPADLADKLLAQFTAMSKLAR